MREPTLQAAFEDILTRYNKVQRAEKFGSSSSVWPLFTTATTILGNAAKSTPNIRVRFSIGQGRWASVPWIAALDGRETDRPSMGIYVIYLFRADGAGVYLTLNQGSDGFVGPLGAARLRRRAEVLRDRLAGKGLAKTFSSRGIELGSDVDRARRYEDSTILFKLYERGKVSSDDRLLADFKKMLDTYVSVVPSYPLVKGE